MIMDGRAVAAQIRAELAVRTALFFEKYGRRPALAAVLAEGDPASETYVRNKLKASEETGVCASVCRLPRESAEEEFLAAVTRLAADDGVDGILVQLPLPAHVDEARILRAIPPEKDVDGFTAENLGRLAKGEEGFVACTPLGVAELLKRYRVPVCGKRAVVVGRSDIVGKPMAALLLNANATVTVCHSHTQDLASECRRADILVVAAGKAGLVTGDMVKEGAAVVDVGINRNAAGKLCGDVCFEEAARKAAYITPVPGGVGPMTVAMLLSNTCKAAELRAK